MEDEMEDEVVDDPNCDTVQGFIDSLHIFAKYMKKGFATKFFLCAEHDILYVQVNSDDCPEDSDDGQKLLSLGWHVCDFDNWAMFV